MQIRILNTTQDLTVGADGELRLRRHDAPEDQRSAGSLGWTGGRNIRHSVQGILSYSQQWRYRISVVEP
jgi:hypothetical protein